MNIGDLVVVTREFINCKADSIGIIYDKYDTDCVSILIVDNGVDLGGFSAEDVEKYVMHTGITIKYYTDYKFQSVIKLNTDYSNGYFDMANGVVENMGKMLIREAKLRKIGVNN
jgi:hypothetical protein